MDAVDLDALDALLVKATPGPWLRMEGDPLKVVQGNLATDTIICRVTGAESNETSQADAALIVASVNALPSLLAHVRALEADAARWVALCNLWFCATEMSLTQDEDGRWSIRMVEPAEDVTFQTLTGDDPDAAIDAARAAAKDAP